MSLEAISHLRLAEVGDDGEWKQLTPCLQNENLSRPKVTSSHVAGRMATAMAGYGCVNLVFTFIALSSRSHQLPQILVNQVEYGTPLLQKSNIEKSREQRDLGGAYHGQTQPHKSDYGVNSGLDRFMGLGQTHSQGFLFVVLKHFPHRIVVCYLHIQHVYYFSKGKRDTGLPNMRDILFLIIIQTIKT